MKPETKTNLMIITVAVAFCAGFVLGMYKGAPKKTETLPTVVAGKQESITETAARQPVPAAGDTEQKRKEAETVFADAVKKLKEKGLTCGLEEAAGNFLLECTGNNMHALLGQKDGKIASIMYQMDIYEHRLVVGNSTKTGKAVLTIAAEAKDKAKIESWFGNCGRPSGYGKSLKLGSRLYNCTLADGVFTFESHLEK